MRNDEKLCYAAIICAIALFMIPPVSIAAVLNDYNPWDVQIPDNGASVNSDLSLSGAPAGAKISKVEVYYEIKHPRPSDLDVWLTCYDGGWQGDFFLHTQGSSSSVDRINVDNIHTWDGKSPNVTWYLVAMDRVTGNVGYIDFFELWITYEANEPPNTPYSPDPSNGASNVPVNSDLDWSCTDPNGDTVYYTVYFEKNDSSPDNIIKNDAAGSSASLGKLDYSSDYYWRVKADDHKGGVTWGPSSGAWYFHTESAPVVNAEITGISFDRADVTRDQETITATVSIRNTGNQSWTFYVSGSSIKDGDTTWYDWFPSRASKTLNPGQSGPISLSWSPDNTVPTGLYGFYSKIFMASSGDDFTDDDWRDSAFQVQLASLPEITDGRIAWHSYTEYDDDNRDGYHSIDGRILVYDFSTGTHNIRAESTIEAGVQHAMNPNFSSDGRYLTFMGLPKTRTYSHYNDSWAEYLDIFIYDFRNDLLTPVSFLMGRGDFGQYEEDPVFSPDGQWIAFKYQRTDIYVAKMSDYSLRQVTAGAGQESGPQYSPDGNWICFWHGDGPEAYIAKVPAGSIKQVDYTIVIDNDSVDFPGDTGVQDYFPNYWDTSRIIYTSWDDAKIPGENDDDDIRILNLSNNANDFANFNSPYPIDDSDAFAISSTLIGFSKRNGSFWDLWYGEPVGGSADSLRIGESNKHNLGGEYTTIIVEYIPNDASPTVSITSPTSSSTYNTSSSSLNIGGSASDNIGVTQVTWANNRGGSGICSGTTSWSRSSITLYGGQNVITVTARDAAGNTGTDTLTVTYAPPDTTPPDTSITSGPSGTIICNDVTFTYTGSDDVTSTSNLIYSYKLEGYDSDWSSYTSSTLKSYNDLPNGSYTFYVKAKDEAGNFDSSPASRSFTVNYSASLSYISISGPTEVNKSSGAQYTCTAHYSDGSTSMVTTSASWSENSSYASINSSGYLTTTSVSSDRSCTISASYEGKSDTHSVTILTEEVADSDGDGIFDDGDSSGTVGDNPCTVGETENCDDNCLYTYNPSQADSDGDGVGDVCDVSTDGYLVTSDLWIRAFINTVEKGPIDAIWHLGGQDTTSRGDAVIWGHFYASPSDVTWGSQNNPDLFVKIWFDVSGRVDVNFFHVSVPDIVVYSDYPYDGTADEQGTTTMSRRYIRQYYEGGQSYSEENYEDGVPPAGYSSAGNPWGSMTINDLRIGSIINTVEKGPVDAVWRFGGQDTTARGDEVVWGHFYANPSDVTWGSEDNPDLFVKIWFDVSGRVDVNFFHVSVPDIDVYSDLPDDGMYDQKGTTIMDNRYIRHEYWR